MARRAMAQEPLMKPARRTPGWLGFVWLAPLTLGGCGRNHFPTYPANYHEFAYVSNGTANTVTVLDLSR
jgi:hypothetical protein